MTTIVVSAKTIEEAISNGLAQLHTSQNRVTVEVLEQPSKGFFGFIGTKPAKVQLTKLPDALEEAVAFLQEVLRTMGLQAAIEQKQSGGEIELILSGDEMGIAIGRRGQTLDALQYLVNIVANHYSDAHIKIVLDAEQFRERRKKTLEELATRLASQVIRTHKEVVLEPMSSQERKFIHARLQDHPKVKTFSKGDEPNRRIVIAPRS